MIILKTRCHLKNVKQFEKDNSMNFSNLKMIRIKIKYRNNMTQLKSSLIVLLECIVHICLIVGMGWSSYMEGDLRATIVFIGVIFFQSYYGPFMGWLFINNEKYLMFK